MATILHFPSGVELEPHEVDEIVSFPPITVENLAEGGIEAIIDLTHYQFLSDESTEQDADIYLLVRGR